MEYRFRSETLGARAVAQRRSRSSKETPNKRPRHDSGHYSGRHDDAMLAPCYEANEGHIGS